MSKTHCSARLCSFVFPLLALFGKGGAAGAQSVDNFPNKPIRLIVPFAPGGGTDITGRIIAAKLQAAWGQPVLCVNQAGASGTIGMNTGAKASADGYTITLVSSSSIMNVHTLPKVPYDFLRDFAPLTQMTIQSYALVVNPSAPFKTVKELVAYAKGHPGLVIYGSAGVGGNAHLSAALLSSLAGIEMTHVPYKGGNPAMQDVIAGNTQLTFSTLVQSLSFIKSGRLRVLGLTNSKRSPAAPDIPTIAEAGVPGYEVDPWYGLLLPAKTPAPIIAKLNREVVKSLHMPDVIQKLSADGSQPVGTTPEEFGALLRSEYAKWGKVVKDNKIKME